MGNPVIQTPNLDALAARGVLFRNAFTPNPICVPARATVMTGNYSNVCTETKNNGGRIREDQPLLTETLKGAGYRTYAVGKLHFVPYSPPGEPRLVHGYEHVEMMESGRVLRLHDPEGKLRGLEDYFDYLKDVGWGGYTRAHGVGNNDVRPCASPLPEEHYVDHWIADRTMHWIDRHRASEGDRPFFMYMSSPKPHSPYDPPRPYDAMYDPRTIPAPFGSAEDLENRNPLMDQVRWSHAIESLSPEALQVIRSYYYGNVSFFDQQIGRVVSHLEETGLLEDTLILFSADHGDLLGDFGAFFKCSHLNGSVRVPMLAAGPGVKRGAVSEAVVGLQDILPTFAGISGADLGEEVHGLDLGAHLADPSVPVREWYYAQTLESPSQSSMICDGTWKYIYSEMNGTEELYDQENDPGELVNLAGRPGQKERLSALRAQLRAEAERIGDTGILDGEGFRRSDADRAEFRESNPRGAMGWRWY